MTTYTNGSKKLPRCQPPLQTNASISDATTHGKVILVAATWVDDVLIAGEPEAVTAFRKEIAADFAVRDFGEPKDFVGGEIEGRDGR